jgi:pimeloyl-ACP methyl ester carboxylesterase
VEVRQYGTKGPHVVLLHGGPGAVGYMAPVARELSDTCIVHEPLQRAHTVAGHVTDLDELIRQLPPAHLVGSSWGAMLALAYAAEHPVRSLFLVGCGTFDERARAKLRETRAARMQGAEPRTYEEWGDVTMRTDSYDLIADNEVDEIDAEAGEASWNDMIRLQHEGVYPAAFASIEVPALLVHGDVDPHPGPLVYASLQPFVRNLQYTEIPRCGHYPWLERHGHVPFFKLLRDWVDTGRILQQP